MRRLVRVCFVPASLVLAAGLVFHRAFDPVELARALAAAAVFGAAAGAALGVRRVPLPVGLIVIAGAFGAGASVVAGTRFSPELVPDATVVFLTVGLPANGLDQLAVVPFVVGFAAMVAAVAASCRHRTLATLAGPVLAVGVGSILVKPVGFGWWVPLLVSLAGGIVLVVDARNDLSQLPALVSTNTESRRQLVWWRPLVQVVPALLAVIALANVLPSGKTVDVRRFVTPRTEHLADPNPLAVAARSSRLPVEDQRELARVEVKGAAPGRLRLAVLDVYGETGWRQAAEFSVTGETLAPDPLYASDAARAPRLAPAAATVTVDSKSGVLRAVPTAGLPLSVPRPEGVRYAARAGILLPPEGTRRLAYRTATAPAEGTPARVAPTDATVATFPPELAACPRSPAIRDIAGQLVAGVPGADERLDRIENFLKVRRVYDPTSPGGQTIRSIERFLSQDYARGNVEAFVTSYALLARCAGVPVRVVVGLPAAVPGANRYGVRDLTAWVETPLARSGWTARDPLPTPDEQRQQAQLALQTERRPEPEPEPAEPAAPPRRVEPTKPGDDGTSLASVALAGAVVTAVLAATAWALVVPALIRRRRRRTADPSKAVHAAWATVTDALVDRNIAIDGQHTPQEVVRVSAGLVPVTLPRLLDGMAPIVDRARYSGDASTDADAGLAWGYAGVALERLGSTWPTRVAALRRPRRAASRLAGTIGVPRRRSPWTAKLPETAVMSSAEAPADIPGVTVAARIGEGSTGTVYRGVLAATSTHVAVKVFRYGPGDAGFDQQRYDWEVRIAGDVSGLPHLPMVHAAGITPVTKRPYLVSSLYEDGTLLDRVRRGGPMTPDEVVAIGTDVATALATLHQLGVVHADVKPENVFSSRDGWVLGDLGSAWLRASRGPAASLTPPYAAPEVWRGASPTPSADLYSLALTMLFAVTGQVPIASNAPARDEVVTAFPDHPVMVRALEPDARRRPRSVADFARQLRPDLVGTPAAAGFSGLSLPTPTVSHPRR